MIEESHQVEDGDQAAIDALVEDQDDEHNDAWAVEFDVYGHRDAVQRAYEEYVADEGTRLIDNVENFEPDA